MWHHAWPVQPNSATGLSSLWWVLQNYIASNQDLWSVSQLHHFLTHNWSKALEDSLGDSIKESGCEESNHSSSQSAVGNVTCEAESLAWRGRWFLRGVLCSTGSVCLLCRLQKIALITPAVQRVVYAAREPLGCPFVPVSERRCLLGWSRSFHSPGNHPDRHVLLLHQGLLFVLSKAD